MKVVKIALFCLLLMAVACFLVGYTTTEYTMHRVTHTVVAGDTLWGIATSYFDRQDRFDHFGEFVYSIQVENSSPLLHVGDEVIVPLYTEGEK